MNKRLIACIFYEAKPSFSMFLKVAQVLKPSKDQIVFSIDFRDIT